MLGYGPHACIQFMNRVILIMGRLGWVVCLSLPHGLGNGPHGLGNGLHLLGIMSQFGIMLHSVFCCSALCRIRGYVVWHYVVQDYVTFGVMSFGIMSHLALCRIQIYFVRLCVVRLCVVWLCVVRRNVVRPTVGVSFHLLFSFLVTTIVWSKLIRSDPDQIHLYTPRNDIL